MSHSTGAANLNGKIYYCEYNGTSDIFLPFLYETQEQLLTNWRRRDWKTCECADKSHHLEVEIFTTYGDGFGWKAIVCPTCLLIVDKLEPDWDNESDWFDWLPWNKQDIKLSEFNGE